MQQGHLIFFSPPYFLPFDFFHVFNIWSNFFPFSISEKNVNLEECGHTCVLFLAKFPLLTVTV